MNHGNKGRGAGGSAGRRLARAAALIATTMLITACAGATGGGGPTAAGGTQAPGAGGGGQTAGSGGGGGGTSLFEKATAVKHFCDLLPTDLVATIVSSPTPPQEMQFPPTCTVYGDKTAMAISLASVNPIGDPPADAQVISGVGTGAYLEKLTTGNFSLWVGLTPDAGMLLVEVDNSDGKDHTDEAVNLAKSVLAKLAS